MRGLQRRQPFWRGDQEDALDPRAARLLEQGDRRRGAAAGGQHRIDQQRGARVHSISQALVIAFRLMGGFVAAQSDDADRRRRQQRLHAGQEAEAGAQDRHQGQFLAADVLHLQWARPGLHRHRLGGQVAGGFEGQQRGDLAGQLAEMHRVGGDVAQLAELVADQRMVDFHDFHAHLHHVAGSVPHARGCRKRGRRRGAGVHAGGAGAVRKPSAPPAGGCGRRFRSPVRTPCSRGPAGRRGC